jgi:hypothetical protein
LKVKEKPPFPPISRPVPRMLNLPVALTVSAHCDVLQRIVSNLSAGDRKYIFESTQESRYLLA